MPRPTPAQLVYGSATVVCSAFALLLFSRTRSVLGVSVIAVAALALGLLAAFTTPGTRPVRRPSRGTVRAAAPTAAPGSGGARPGAAVTQQVTAAPAGTRTGRQLPEPSLHR